MSPNQFIITPKSIDEGMEGSEVGLTMSKGCIDKSRQLFRVYQQIAQETNVHYVDANDFIEKYNEIDFMHLEKQGHHTLAKELSQSIPELI